MAVHLDYWSVEGQLPVESMPLCPFCDQPMQLAEQLKLVACGSYVGLAHASCCIMADEDEDEDDD